MVYIVNQWHDQLRLYVPQKRRTKEAPFLVENWGRRSVVEDVGFNQQLLRSLRFCAAERWHVGRAFKSHGNRSVRHVKALSVVGFLPNLYLKVEIFRSHNRDQISYMKYYARWFFYIVIYFIFSLSPLLYKPPLILSISLEEGHLDIKQFSA